MKVVIITTVIKFIYYYIVMIFRTAFLLQKVDSRLRHRSPLQQQVHIVGNPCHVVLDRYYKVLHNFCIGEAILRPLTILAAGSRSFVLDERTLCAILAILPTFNVISEKVYRINIITVPVIVILCAVCCS